MPRSGLRMDTIVEHLDRAVRGLSGLTAGLGLFGIAFFDSSLLSLPEVNDVLLVYFSTRFPAKAFYYASMTTLGSVAGGSLLFGLARWKGYGLLVRRFSARRLERVAALVRRYGALAVFVPSMLPPPFPFKIFVLSSGALGLPQLRFLAAILAGRAVRYFGEAWLALRYGEQAMSFLHENAGNVLLAAGAAVLALALSHLWMRRRRRRRRSVEPLEPRPVPEP